jgi:NADH:ubiquinone oxidoreductase subunit 6 (subunit J)
MVLALMGMIWCAKKQKTNPNAQTYAVVCLVVVFICAVGVMIQTGVFGSGGETQRLIQNELAYSKAKAVVVGRYLAEKFPGSKALVITDGSNPLNNSQQQLLDGLKEGLGSAVTVLSAEGLPIDKTNMKPEEFRPMEE